MIVLEGITKTQLVPLKKHGFKLVKPKGKYEKYRLKGPANIILYTTGKLVVNGKKEGIKETKKLLRKLGIKIPRQKTNKKKQNKDISGKVIGSDETLKGDTFGGIVVCAFKADAKIREQLIDLGVRDSKTFNNADITKLARKLMTLFSRNYSVENIYPKEYNKLNKKKNVTEIMNYLHEKCYKKLAKRKKITYVIDKYPGCKVGDIVEPKAESKYPEVAAASIIARFCALKQIRDLEQTAGFFIPMGSTHVTDAVMEIKRKSLDPRDYVKMKFKNVKEFF
ncbi:hypothetical protein GF327_04460 [Candidatus Woesearchaeota archaeon]|nr:hypothetical protein [Candidatus Woesearchaeota archaeon]